jgi:hypothetical protein
MPAGRCLDVGSASGGATRHLLPSAVSVDIHTAALAAMKRHDPKCARRRRERRRTAVSIGLFRAHGLCGAHRGIESLFGVN